MAQISEQKKKEALKDYKESRKYVKDVVSEMLRNKDNQLVRAMMSHSRFRRSLEQRITKLGGVIDEKTEEIASANQQVNEYEHTVGILNKALLHNTYGATGINRELQHELMGRSKVQVMQSQRQEEFDTLNNAVRDLTNQVHASKLKEDLLERDVATLRHALELVLGRAENSMEVRGKEAVELLVVEAAQDLEKINELKEDPHLMQLALERQAQLAEVSAVKNEVEKLRNDKKTMETALRKAEQEVVQMRLKMMERDSSMAVASRKVKAVERKLHEEQSTSEARIAAAERMAGEVTRQYEEHLKKQREEADLLKRKVVEQGKHVDDLKHQLTGSKFEVARIRKEMQSHTDSVRTEFERELEVATAKVTSLEAQLKQETEELVMKCAAAENAAFKRNKEVEDLRKEVKASQDQLSSTKEMLRAKQDEADNNRIIARSQNMEAQLIRDANQRIRDLEAENTRMEEEFSSMRASLEKELRSAKSSRSNDAASPHKKGRRRSLSTKSPVTRRRRASEATSEVSGGFRTPAEESLMNLEVDPLDGTSHLNSGMASLRGSFRFGDSSSRVPTPQLSPVSASLLDGRGFGDSKVRRAAMTKDWQEAMASITGRIKEVNEWRAEDARSAHATIAVKVDRAVEALSASLIHVAQFSMGGGGALPQGVAATESASNEFSGSASGTSLPKGPSISLTPTDRQQSWTAGPMSPSDDGRGHTRASPGTGGSRLTSPSTNMEPSSLESTLRQDLPPGSLVLHEPTPETPEVRVVAVEEAQEVVLQSPEHISSPGAAADPGESSLPMSPQARRQFGKRNGELPPIDDRTAAKESSTPSKMEQQQNQQRTPMSRSSSSGLQSSGKKASGSGKKWAQFTDVQDNAEVPQANAAPQMERQDSASGTGRQVLRKDASGRVLVTLKRNDVELDSSLGHSSASPKSSFMRHLDGVRSRGEGRTAEGSASQVSFVDLTLEDSVNAGAPPSAEDAAEIVNELLRSRSTSSDILKPGLGSAPPGVVDTDEAEGMGDFTKAFMPKVSLVDAATQSTVATSHGSTQASTSVVSTHEVKPIQRQKHSISISESSSNRNSVASSRANSILNLGGQSLTTPGQWGGAFLETPDASLAASQAEGVDPRVKAGEVSPRTRSPTAASKRQGMVRDVLTKLISSGNASPSLEAFVGGARQAYADMPPERRRTLPENELTLTVVVGAVERSERQSIVTSSEQVMWEIFSAFRTDLLELEMKEREAKMEESTKYADNHSDSLRKFILSRRKKEESQKRSHHRHLESVKMAVALLRSSAKKNGSDPSAGFSTSLDEINRKAEELLSKSGFVQIDEALLPNVPSGKFNDLVNEYSQTLHELESQRVTQDMDRAMHTAMRERVAELEAQIEKHELAARSLSHRGSSLLPSRNDSLMSDNPLSPMLAATRGTSHTTTPKHTHSVPSTVLSSPTNADESKEAVLSSLYATVGGFLLEAQGLLHSQALPTTAVMREGAELVNPEHVTHRLKTLLDGMKRTHDMNTTELKRLRKKRQKVSNVGQPEALQVVGEESRPGSQQRRASQSLSARPGVAGLTPPPSRGSAQPVLGSSASTLSVTGMWDIKPDVADAGTDALEMPPPEIEVVERVSEFVSGLGIENKDVESHLRELMTVVAKNEGASLLMGPERRDATGTTAGLEPAEDWAQMALEDSLQPLIEKVKRRLGGLALGNALDESLQAAVALDLDRKMTKPVNGKTAGEVLTATRQQSLESAITHLSSRVTTADTETKLIDGIFRRFPRAYVDQVAQKCDDDVAYELVRELTNWWSNALGEAREAKQVLFEDRQGALVRILQLCDLLENAAMMVRVEYEDVLSRREAPRPHTSSEMPMLADYLRHRGQVKQREALKMTQPESPHHQFHTPPPRASTAIDTPNPFWSFTLRDHSTVKEHGSIDPPVAEKVTKKLKSLTRKPHEPGPHEFLVEQPMSPPVKVSMMPTVAQISPSSRWNGRAKPPRTPMLPSVSPTKRL